MQKISKYFWESSSTLELLEVPIVFRFPFIYLILKPKVECPEALEEHLVTLE